MRLVAIALVPLFAAAVAAADDPPAADPVAAAKQDLAEIKAPAGQQDAASALPSLDIKDLGPVPGAQRPDPAPLSQEKDPSLDPSKKKSGTGNWLVDAMDKSSDRQKDPRARGKDDASKDELELLLGEKTENGADKDPLAQVESARERDDAKDADTAPSKAYNPLDSFMSSWVSANDRELLVPSKPDLSRTDLIPGLDGSSQAAPAESGSAAAEAGSFSDAGPANPYVGALDAILLPQAKVPALADPADFESLLGPDVSKGLSAPAPDAAAGVDPRNFVPDFAQPSDDDKYFKQLKRF